MTNPRTIRIVILAISTAGFLWTVPAMAQMTLMIDEILLSDHGFREMASGRPAVVVDGSGRWLALRSITDRRGKDDMGMAELLEFEAGTTIGAFEAVTAPSAEDYRYLTTVSGELPVWGYDEDPLDRGRYKNEFEGSTTAAGGVGAIDRLGTKSGGASTASPAKAERTGRKAIDINGVVAALLRGPSYILNAMKSVYGNEQALILGFGLFIFGVGLTTLMDLLRGVRRI